MSAPDHVRGYIVGYITNGDLVIHNGNEVHNDYEVAERYLRGAWLRDQIDREKPRPFRLYAMVEESVNPTCPACAGSGYLDIPEAPDA